MLWGRDGDLDALAGFLRDDRPVAVAGEAGIGKTALVRAACAATGRSVFEGGALATLGWMDHLPFRRAIGRDVQGGDSAAVAEDIQDVVGAGILLLDDLQWAADATAAVTQLLAGRITIVAVVRTGDPGSNDARKWLADAGFAELELAPLDPVSATAVVRGARPDLSPSAVERVVSRSGGNPLLLGELAATGDPSASLQLSLNARLRHLAPAARDAFALLALAGRPLTVEAVGAEAAEALVEAHIAVVDGNDITVRHALIGEVAISDLDEQRRRELHSALARLTPDDGEAARHYEWADERDLAHDAAMRAAESAIRPGERASHLALAAACATGPEADRLRMRAAWALDEANDWPRMVATLDQLESDDPEVRAEAALLRARGAWAGGDADTMRSALGEGLALVDGSGTDIEVRLRIEQSRVPTFLDADTEAGVRIASAALEVATSTGVDLARAHYLLGTALGMASKPGWEEHLETALARAREAGDTQTEFNAASNLIGIHEMAGSHPAARTVAARMIDRAHELGLGYWETALGAMIVNLDTNDGNYGDAIAAADVLLERPADSRARDILVEATGVCLIDLGRMDEALALVSSLRDSGSPDHMGQLQLLWVLAEAALWDGQPARALQLSDQFLADVKDTVAAPLGAVTRAWACVDLGMDPGPASPPEDRPFCSAAPHETEALRLLHAGDHRGAAAGFERAAALWAPYHLRGELRCLWAHADALRRAGDDSAVPLLEAVEVRVAERGMLPLLGRIHRSLRAAGQRRSTPRSAAGHGAGAELSGRERAVVDLVAAGLTNDQIAARLGITRRTVETQLAAASVKLGATTRSQVAVLAARGGTTV